MKDKIKSITHIQKDESMKVKSIKGKKQNKKKDKKKHKKRSDSKKKQKNKKNNKKRVEKKKSTYPSEDEDVYNLTWDEKEERTKHIKVRCANRIKLKYDWHRIQNSFHG